jgi:outer membrane lipoprotein-sorting protein
MMSTPKLPIGARIEAILKQEATTSIPGDASIWSAILEAGASARISSQTGRAAAASKLGGGAQPSNRTTHPPVGRERRRLLVGAAVVALLAVAASIGALLALTGLLNPTPVSAAQILTQAAAAGQQSYAGRVHSTHAIMTVRFRNDPAAPLAEIQLERWDQAPDKSRTLSTAQAPDNSQSWAVVGKVGTTKYTYTSGAQVFRIDPIKRPATTVGADMDTATAEASSVGSFSAYDAVVTGTESLLGRTTYVLNLVLKGGQDKTTGIPQSQFSAPQYHKQVWVDAESYLILQEYDWNRDGILLYEATCRQLDINPQLDASLFEFSPPDGYKVVDTRPLASPTK